MDKINLLLAMVWVLSGLSVAFFMRTTDESRGSNYTGKYWIKGRGGYFRRVAILVIIAPFALILGIVVAYDYCSKE